ncbi:MAG: LacI family DNA-binding transcriptional regulator [Anaerolineae bacterium]|nr:LacI family DNA-binding transcriptional regulator [Anaerolineae bacterium]MBL6965168.1 LacI family DNA-binding transcriptional regulator [Anaerolineales bacterium]
MPRSRVTIRDVAAQAGVSHQTVSRVINNSERVSSATRQRVETAITALNYQPSRLARSLATQKTHTIGLVVADITNPFFFEVARGVQDTALAQGYNVFVCNTDDNPRGEQDVLTLMASQEVDGVILSTASSTDEELLAFVENYKPLVVINREIDHPKASLVNVDIYTGAKLAVEHLISRGHSHIGMLTHQGHNPDEVRRVQGYRDVLHAHGMTINPNWIVLAPPNLAGGYSATQQLLTAFPEITAIFAYNDLMAIGALRGCYDMGLQIPQECAIMGFDDIKFSEMMQPSLSSIRFDKYLVGQKAMLRLLEMLKEPDAIYDPIRLDVELVIREST